MHPTDNLILLSKQVGLTGMSRLPGYSNAALPATTAFVEGAVWPALGNYRGDSQFMVMYEPLTHGHAAPGS